MMQMLTHVTIDTRYFRQSSRSEVGDDIIAGETTTTEQKDNDAIGDGNRDPCDVIFWECRRRQLGSLVPKSIRLTRV